MKRNVMRKNLLQSIRRSIGRYIAIVAIIALGAGLFVGLLATKTDMVATGQAYMDEQNMFDLRLLNPYGWSQTELDVIAQMDGVESAEGVVTLDVIASVGETGSEGVYQLISIPQHINRVYLLGGRMPETPNECLADSNFATDAILGTTIKISDTNSQDTQDALSVDQFTIVGYVSTPIYMDMSRGTTTLGNGVIHSFVYVPKAAFDVDYFTEISITIPGDYPVYTEVYDDAMTATADALQPHLKPLAMNRYECLRTDAKTAYKDGLLQYQDGLTAFRNGKQETLKQLSDAHQELLDGQREFDANQQLLADGEMQLEEGQTLLDGNKKTLSDSRITLAETKAAAYAQLAQANAELLENYKTVAQQSTAVVNALAQIDDGLFQINNGISQLESGLEQLELMISITETMISVMDASIQTAQAALDRAQEDDVLDEEMLRGLEERLQEAKDKKDTYVQQNVQMHSEKETYGKQLEELKAQRDSIYAQKTELEAAKAPLQEAMAAIDQGFLELQNSQTQAENEFASAEAKLASAQLQLNRAQEEISLKASELEEGRAALAKAEQQLESGWMEYYQAAEQAEQEFADAQAELDDAKAFLIDAADQISQMEPPEVYLLDRNTNAGYLAVDSNSDIVAGVSRVFPVFFLLVAALVCITTMTRMVEEERTQIGTLKALGYGSFAIIGKYLAYAGSAAIIGCGLGVLVGSIVFPNIIWVGYSLILTMLPSLRIVFDIPLCICVVCVYTAVTVFVTWYCCKVSLREVPAELIRPKVPTSGRKILLEYLPFWKHMTFLNKVMLRNIFRYRQRLLMMLVGIGGCTALLVTGFGIGDSIVDIVSYQFEDVTLYDMQVQFASGRSEQAQQSFRDALGSDAEIVSFAHQSSVDISCEDATRNIYMIAAGEDIQEFFDFHNGDSGLAMPVTGEALLSVGVAEAMGIQTGEMVTLRNSENESMTVTISGIFDNNVYNYVIVTPETVEQKWSIRPEFQIAYLNVPDDRDVHEVGATVASLNDVMNVMISQDLADQVGSMLDAMNVIVATVVICAGLLAVIVLYNLTNINITERIREIATIKVLGFNACESALYVFKENLLLSALGAVLGLIGGKFLLEFVMSLIRIDMVWMQARIQPLSLICSVLITLLMACLVDYMLYFRLEKINMAEALKSVE